MWMEIHTNLANQLRNPPNENTMQLWALSWIPYHIYQPAQKEARTDLVCAWNEQKWQAERDDTDQKGSIIAIFSKRNVRPEWSIDRLCFSLKSDQSGGGLCVFLSLFSLSSPDLAFGFRNPMELCDSFQTVISHQHGVMRNLVNNGSKKYWHCAVRISSD